MSIAVLVCERMFYTYEQYLDQPEEFIDSILNKMRAEAEESRKTSRKVGGADASPRVSMYKE